MIRLLLCLVLLAGLDGCALTPKGKAQLNVLLLGIASGGAAWSRTQAEYMAPHYVPQGEYRASIECRRVPQPFAPDKIVCDQR